MQRAAVAGGSLRSRAPWDLSLNAIMSFYSRLSFTVLCLALLHRMSESPVSFKSLEAEVKGNSTQIAAKSLSHVSSIQRRGAPYHLC